MTKLEFLAQLKDRLSSLSQGDVNRSLDFYSEMIDDRIEDGMSEGEAVANVGDLDRIAEQILSQSDLPQKPVEPQPQPEPTTLRYVLRNPLVVGILSPFLLVLWAIALVVILSLWTVIVSLYAGNVILGVTGGTLLISGTALFFSVGFGNGLLVFGAGVVLIGLTILWGVGCKYATLGVIKLTKLIFRGLVAMILRKEGAV